MREISVQCLSNYTRGEDDTKCCCCQVLFSKFTMPLTNSDSPLGLRSCIAIVLFRLKSPASVANLPYLYHGMLHTFLAAVSTCLCPGKIQGFLLRCNLHLQREVAGRPVLVREQTPTVFELEKFRTLSSSKIVSYLCCGKL